MMNCQKCGGEIQGWTCQGCEQLFCDGGGKLVFDTPSPIPAAPSDVAGVKLFPPETTGVQSRIIIVHQLRASADIQDNEITRTMGRKATTDRASLMREAAALIESLSHDREVMREALEPFAKAGKAIDANGFGVALFPSDRTAFEATWSEGGQQSRLTWGDFRRATLASLKGGA